MKLARVAAFAAGSGQRMKRTADKDFVAIVASDSSGLRELAVACPKLPEAELERRRRFRNVEGADAVVGLVDDEEALGRSVQGEPVWASQLSLARTFAAKAATNAREALGRRLEGARRQVGLFWQVAEGDLAVFALGHPATIALVAGDARREHEVVPLARMRVRTHVSQRHKVNGVAQRARNDKLSFTQCKVGRPIKTRCPNGAPRRRLQDGLPAVASGARVTKFDRCGQPTPVVWVRLGWRSGGWRRLAAESDASVLLVHAHVVDLLVTPCEHRVVDGSRKLYSRL